MFGKLIDIISRNYMGLPTTPTEKLIYLGATSVVMAGTAYALKHLEPYIQPLIDQAQHAEHTNTDYNQAA